MMDSSRKEKVDVTIIIFMFVLFLLVFIRISDSVAISLADVIGEFQITMGDNLSRFALLVNFLYELIPQTFQLLGIGAIYVKALESGTNPLFFIITGSTGKIIGQIGLYYAGYHGLRRLLNKQGGMASAEHWMHKYHYLVFAIPPFGGALGDIIMVFAGHQKIRLLKILPILVIADVLDQARWVFWTMAQIEGSDFISNM